jgi:alpha-tubulin suppressor-like RCC1 family protein
MPTFYNFTENGVVYSFDDIFVPADLFREGNLWTWGNGSNGQLGNASTVNTSTPVTTFLGGTNWKQVSGGSPAVGGIKTDGTLWLWGLGTNGRLGNASTVNTSTPVTTFLGGTNWKQVSGGSPIVGAIKTDGTLWTWGDNTLGQLGAIFLPTTNISTPITTFLGGTNWKKVDIGRDQTGAIKTDGTLWTWGVGSSGQLGNASLSVSSTPVTTFSGGTNWNQVSCGGGQTAAIKTDGTLWIWGSNANGRLGNASTVSTSTPVTTFSGGTDWKQVSCGYYHTAAIKTDGTLWLWGLGINGRLGNASTVDRTIPVTTFLGGTDWKQVFSGNAHTAAIKTDGTLWIWGLGTNGRLGNATITPTISTPVTTFLGGTNWKQVSIEGGSVDGANTLALTYIDPIL